MDIPVLVEPVANNGFRAVSGGPLHLETEAPTREKLRQLIERRVAAGAEVVAVCIDTSTHPLAAFAGMLKDDPSVAPWKRAMADYREKRDAGPDMPRVFSFSTPTPSSCFRKQRQRDRESFPHFLFLAARLERLP